MGGGGKAMPTNPRAGSASTVSPVCDEPTSSAHVATRPDFDAGSGRPRARRKIRLPTKRRKIHIKRRGRNSDGHDNGRQCRRHGRNGVANNQNATNDRDDVALVDNSVASLPPWRNVISILDDDDDDDDDCVIIIDGDTHGDKKTEYNDGCKTTRHQHRQSQVSSCHRNSTRRKRLRKRSRHEVESERNDEQIARLLQQEFDTENRSKVAARLQREETTMACTLPGKALEFVMDVMGTVEKLIARHRWNRRQEEPAVSILAKDDLVFLTEAFMNKREEFKAANEPVHVDLGFHFTSTTNLAHIRTDGLLTKKERTQRNITAHFNGSALGDGVYTADDTSYGGGKKYGSACLLVARLQGGAKDTVRQGSVKVLKTSSQCLALVHLDWQQVSQDPELVKLVEISLRTLVARYF